VSSNQLFILWDIDGTLVTLPQKSSKRHLEVVQKYTDRSLMEPGATLGKTDIGLIKEIFEINQLDFVDKDILNCLNSLDLRSLNESYQSLIRITPGIEEALDYCFQVGAVNTLLTGNSKNRALHKLNSTKLVSKFSLNLGFFGDQAFSRELLVKLAKSNIEETNRKNLILIGDTTLDIQAAQKNDLRILASATGAHSYGELKDFEPDFIIRNFTEDIGLFKEIISKLV
jgi:phosphoglycolate phosphatase-like HAD superfamily hydrolase